MKTTTQRVFTDLCQRPVLKHILLAAINDLRQLYSTCRNLRDYMNDDPFFRSICENLTYSVPPIRHSLDGDLPNKRTDPRPLAYNESFRREESLQVGVPVLTRCVQPQGQVLDVRDGYMVTKSSGGTGWTLWALPLAHEVRKTYLKNRDEVKFPSPAEDTIPLQDIQLPPRPKGAFEQQRMWTWQFEWPGKFAALAIYPEDNLVAVAARSVIVPYAGKRNTPLQTGRAHRVYFYQLRPYGLENVKTKVKAASPNALEPHPRARLPYLEFILPYQITEPDVSYTLKIGPNGLVGLLVKREESRSCVTGPLIVFNYVRGHCVAVIGLDHSESRIIDFDFFSPKHIVLLNVCPLSDTERATYQHSPTVALLSASLVLIRISPNIGHALNVAQLQRPTGGQGPSVILSHPPGTWTSCECYAKSPRGVVALELPPLADNKTPRDQAHQMLKTVSGTVSINPPLSLGYLGSMVSYALYPHGIAQESPRPALRGRINAALFIDRVAMSTRRLAVEVAMRQWRKQLDESNAHGNEVLGEEFDDLLCLMVVGHQGSFKESKANGEVWRLHFYHEIEFPYPLKVFTSIIEFSKSMEDQGILAKLIDELRIKGADINKLPDRPFTHLLEVIKSSGGMQVQAKMFAQLLGPPLRPMQGMVPDVREEWQNFADMQSTWMVATATHGPRAIDIEPFNNESHPPPKTLPPDDKNDKKIRHSNFLIKTYAGGLYFPGVHLLSGAELHPLRRKCAPDCKVHHTPMLVLPIATRRVCCSTPRRTGRGFPASNIAPHTPTFSNDVISTPYPVARDLDGKPIPDKVLTQPKALAYCEAQSVLVCDQDSIKEAYFDGQSLVLAQHDHVSILCF